MQNQFRIIGGAWRSRRFTFPDVPGLRPSPDRVRETVFNWLAPVIDGARCIDLFAGSGALGFEAASRGAAEVVLVERDAGLAANLRTQAARLHAGNVHVHHADALAWLRAAGGPPFDIVFLDPPFDAGLWEPAAALLGPWLAPGARVYVESPAGRAPALPPGWHRHRAGATRDVEYALFRTGDGPPRDAADTLPPGPSPQGDPPA